LLLPAGGFIPLQQPLEIKWSALEHSLKKPERQDKVSYAQHPSLLPFCDIFSIAWKSAVEKGHSSAQWMP
jgi:hypothetical protein